MLLKSIIKFICRDVSKMCVAPRNCNIYAKLYNEHDPCLFWGGGGGVDWSFNFVWVLYVNRCTTTVIITIKQASWALEGLVHKVCVRKMQVLSSQKVTETILLWLWKNPQPHQLCTCFLWQTAASTNDKEWSSIIVNLKWLWLLMVLLQLSDFLWESWWCKCALFFRQDLYAGSSSQKRGRNSRSHRYLLAAPWDAS